MEIALSVLLLCVVVFVVLGVARFILKLTGRVIGCVVSAVVVVGIAAIVLFFWF